VKVSAELWREVEPLLSAAIDMEAHARVAWLAGIDATHPDVAPVLREMIRVHERAQRAGELESAPGSAASAPWSSSHVAGMRIGPFELVRLLGHGGMGEVWLARQVDGRVRRDVALKLPTILQPGGAWRERFRRERDILARLEHPNIARFHDAGVTDSGQPWLAMEYAAGMTLSAHLASRPHRLAERLALARQVLSAVAHAHRHLVVHRDLKPANVLVDPSGVVKLLDFGIAKLLEEGDGAEGLGDLTRLGGRVMTLRYAAPEQAAGGSITTATDIYSLGVMLHEVVTGLSPYRAVRSGKPPTDSMLLDEQSTLPSRLPLAEDFARQCGLAKPRQLARALAGDLDAIMLKAMRRDPAQRYASVELFDADIAGYLQGQPVKARAGTSRYIAGRFVMRHKLPLALAASILLTLVAGLVVAEAERRNAVAEKARAERHLASVRKLANTFIYEVHAKIERLPGSLAARQTLIATSLEYLDALAAEPGRDPALLLEAAIAYRSIANTQGQHRTGSTANYPAATANLRKSSALLTELERLKPGDIATVREHWRTSFALAENYYQVADERWRAEFSRAIRLAGAIADTPGASHDDRALRAFTTGRESLLTALANGRTPATMEAMLRSIAQIEALQGEAPPEAMLRERLEVLYGNAGVMLAGPGEGTPRTEEGTAHLEKSLALARVLRAEAPGDARRQGRERIAALILARHLAATGELRRASALMAEATVLIDERVAQAPDDVALAIHRLEILVAAADIAHRLGEHRRAVALSRDLLAKAAKLPDESVNTRDARIHLIEAKVILGYALVATADAASGDRGRNLGMLLEARSLFAEVSLFLEAVRAHPTFGAVPEYKLREFALARARLQRALAKHGVS
jgi:serine/threonine protein kinase